ncbi:class IV adenylate cyclase [Streptomyces olivaceiscleroticus]|uniref:Class IV adenylate cyclase n=1 Tax=Streptomyces olivaceiscleroticus TaxID=68245 RepID=A0ABN0ZNX5_9ACTN
MIEAELKARVHHPEGVLQALESRAAGRAEVYQDTYYDTPDRRLAAQDRELRVRTVHGPDDTRSVLTYKTARVDEASGSKPEHETHISNPEAVHTMLRDLGYLQAIAFEKRCRNFTFTAHGRPMLATLVRVPEIEGTFLEIETQAQDEDELPASLDAVRTVMTELGLTDTDFTTEQYTDAVRQYRAR